MSTAPSSTIGQKVWIGARFVLFGFVGFWVMLYSTASLVLTVLGPQHEFFSPYLSAPLTVLGALMMVYGLGEWKRRRAAKIQDSIRQVLCRDWNPIGFGEALPADEYDSYIAPVYRILVGSRSEQELVEFLFSAPSVTPSVCRASRESICDQSHADSWSFMSDSDDVV